MDAKQVRRHFSLLGFTFLLGIAIIYALNYVMEQVCLWKPELVTDANRALILSVLPMYLLGMPALIWLVRRIPGETPVQHSMKPGHFIQGYIICVPLMYGSNIIGLIITSVIGMLKGSPVENQVSTILDNTNLGVIFFVTVICAPIYEEYIFRKLVVDRTVKYGKSVAVLLSGIMFGLFHGNLNQFVYATLLGMFLAFIYVNTGKLRYSIGLHMLVNFMGGVASTWLLRQMNLEEITMLEQAGVSEEQPMTVYMENLPGIMMFGAFFLLIICLGIAGVVLLVLHRKKLVLPRQESDIPRGKAFSWVLCNAGMILYCIFWIGKIVYQLL
ncbi:MAG: CPBP family intramembrane metalloprotease [Lachnospiraceae bacterium]|nr:CPBP family intramembrane metalloprotease [Lachnospiraceae bacterium]